MNQCQSTFSTNAWLSLSPFSENGIILSQVTRLQYKSWERLNWNGTKRTFIYVILYTVLCSQVLLNYSNHCDRSFMSNHQYESCFNSAWKSDFMAKVKVYEVVPQSWQKSTWNQFMILLSCWSNWLKNKANAYFSLFNYRPLWPYVNSNWAHKVATFSSTDLSSNLFWGFEIGSIGKVTIRNKQDKIV